MKLVKSLLLGAVMLGTPLLARAQDSAAVAPPSSAAGPVDPARLAAARKTIDYVFPTGTYARIMGKSMDAMMGPMMDNVGSMPLGSLAGIAGATPADVAKLGKGTLADMMSILDPAYRQRLQITSQVMVSEMTGVLSQVEPGMREGLSHAYARRFDLAQLGELNRFFSTPTGTAYAAESMTIMTDPDVMAQMQRFMPVLLKRMPEIMAKVQSATAKLPKARKYEDLTDAEKARFSALMGSSASASEPAQ